MNGFMNRIEYVYDDAVRLVLTQASVEPPEGQSAFLVDLDVIWESSEGQDLDRIMKIVDDLHGREGDAFEAIITNETRKVFNGNR